MTAIDSSDAASADGSSVGGSPARAGALLSRHRVLASWVLVCIVALVFLERFRTPTTYWFDEWAFIFDRRQNTADAFLAPHNGHLSILPVLVYRVLFLVVGIDRYRPYRLAGLLTHVLVASLVYRYVRVRLGSIAAIAVGVVVLLLGSGWQNIFWPFQVGFMGTVAGGVAAWILLDRGTRAGDRWASVAVGAALACSGGGIPVVIGTSARLAAERNWRRMIEVVAPPAALYVAWYAFYGNSEGSSDNVGRLPRFVSNEASSAMAGIFGRSIGWGQVLMMVLVVGAGILLVRRTPISTATLAPLVCMVSYWMLIGYSRAQHGEYSASRYVYVGAVMLLLVMSDLFRALRGRTLAGVVVVVALLSVWGNWSLLHRGADGLRTATKLTRVELRAMEWARPLVDPAFRPDTYLMPQVSAGQYFAAVDDLGSAAALDGEVAVSDDAGRSQADRVSLEAMRVALVSASAPGDRLPNTVVGRGTQPGPEAGKCLVVDASAGLPERQIEITFVAGTRVLVESADESILIRLRRYASEPPNVPTFTMDGGSASELVIPADSAPLQTWMLDARSASNLRICNAS